MNEKDRIEEIKVAFNIYDEIKKITEPLLIYSLQRVIEERILKLEQNNFEG